VRCRLNMDPSLSIVSIDRDILSRTFTDLIRNAAREMDKGGELHISYRLLKNMGGLLSYSQGENEMVFTVSLPKRASSISEGGGTIAL